MLLVANISALTLASSGAIFNTLYETGSDAGVGSGSAFEYNAISTTDVTMSGRFDVDPIIAIRGDGIIETESGENCISGQSISCTSLSSTFIGGTAECIADKWQTINCTRASSQGSGPAPAPSAPSGPSAPSAPAPVHEAAKEESAEEDEARVCGNLIIEEGEQCDDGNTISGDGCSSTCMLEEGIVLTFKAYPEKRLPATGNSSNVYTVNFYIRGTRDRILSTQLNTNNSGTGQIITSELPYGTYDIALKGMSHLRIFVPDIRIEGDTFIDVTHKTILAGDLQGDNFVNALDISKLLSMLYTSQLLADLNRDGIVNALDIGILLANLYRAGE